jgi:hypothetical protein
VTTGEPSTDSFTFVVTGPQDYLLRRCADAALDINPKAKAARALFGLFGLVFLLYGIVELRSNVAFGLVVITFALAYIQHCALRSSIVRRYVKATARDPYVVEDTTYVIDPSGLHTRSATASTSYAWVRLEEVRAHDGGILLVGRSGRWLRDIPPSAFADQEQKRRAFAAMQAWIVDAKLAEERGSTPGR